MDAIEAKRVGKRFGKVRALDGVTFAIAKGEIVGLLGENGAGKTTMLRVLAGFLAPDEGTVRIGGVDVVETPLEAQRRLGYLPEHAPLYLDMRVEEYLRMRGRLKGVADSLEGALGRFGLGDVRRRIIGDLSKGYRQRVGLADAVLGGPDALILDEPTAGLDPRQLTEVCDVIREIGRDRAVLISSHDLRQIEAVATRIVILRKGRIAADEGVTTADTATGVIVVVAPGDAARAAEALGGAEILDEAAGRLRVRMAADEVARRLVGAGCAVREIRPEERGVEEMFEEATRPPPGGAT